jgi:hypothetical protein
MMRQVGVFVKINPANSMANFNFDYAVLDYSTTFIFGSWVCITNGSSGFDCHLANPKEPKTLSMRGSNIINNQDDPAGNLGEMLLPDFAKEIEEKLIFKTSSTCSPINLRLESTQSETHCVQPMFGLRNPSSIYLKMIGSIYSTPEEDQLRVRDIGATARRGLPFSTHTQIQMKPPIHPQTTIWI